jgi:hypothetical protein
VQHLLIRPIRWELALGRDAPTRSVASAGAIPIEDVLTTNIIGQIDESVFCGKGVAI